MTKRLAVAPGLETIDERLTRSGVSRRAFIKFCSSLMIVAAFGLALTDKLTPEAVAADLGKVIHPHVIWSAHWRGLGCLPQVLRQAEDDNVPGGTSKGAQGSEHGVDSGKQS